LSSAKNHVASGLRSANSFVKASVLESLQSEFVAALTISAIFR
jgi:hypothetical protein